MASKNIGFVWIPKTGGSDLTRYFSEQCQNIIIPDEHNNTGRDYSIPCFTILREPIEKFISAFRFLHIKNYVKNIYKKDNNSSINFDNIDNIDDFLDNATKNVSDPLIKVDNINDFLDNISDNDLIDIIYFQQQYTWLNNENMYIVKYDTIDLYKNIIEMLKHEFEIIVNYDNKIIEHERINVSDKTGLQCELTSYNMERLQRLYKKDYYYYNIFNSNNITYYQLRDFVI
jgi:hypothetical protein